MRPEPLDEASAPPSDRYCDLVLTGGVTDGVVYPWAVIELARHYHFKNIGGTSVGAMAAALTAAAEYSRRRGHLVGFNEVMMKIPERLAECVPGVGTRIYSLFQPKKSTERLFELFVQFFSSSGVSLQKAAAAHIGGVDRKERKRLDHPSWLTRIVSKVESSFAATLTFLTPLTIAASVYRGAAVLGAAIGLALFIIVFGLALDGAMGATSWLTVPFVSLMPLFIGLPLIAVFGLVAVALAIRHDILHGMLRNHYGICTGLRPAHIPANRPSLIEWLHEGVQLAALKPLNEPLTFGDLWNAPGGPRVPNVPATRRKKSRSIDLRMITTNVTHGRPYEFPVDEDRHIFFKRSELRRFFPPSVVCHLVRHSLTYEDACKKYPALPKVPDAKHLRLLPREQLPVVVAARLSLSFPFLFSAVPLWEIDQESDDPNDWGIRRCRYSDGGICSNFPIHMFDAAVPEWPTFGIALETRSVFRPDTPIWLTKQFNRGGEDSWFRFDQANPRNNERPTMNERLMGFVGGIFYSAKDWNDKSAMRLPGVRDRIVHVSLKTAGGLNLRIKGCDIMDLARDYGGPAGRELVAQFIKNNQPAPAWEEHRWVRFHTFLTGLRDRIEMFRDAAENHRYGRPMSAHIQDATREPPLSGADSAARILTDEEAADLRRLLETLEELERLFAQASLPQPYQPVPVPGLHIRAPL